MNLILETMLCEHSDNQEDSDVCLRIKKGKEQQSGHIPTKKKTVLWFFSL